MRLRLISLIAATAVAIWIGYFLWPQGMEAPAPTTFSPPVQSRTVPKKAPPPTQQEANPEMEVPGTFIQGITTDTSGSPLEGTDILHRLLTIAPDQHCHDLNIELELDSTTELLTSDARGLFLLPFQAITASDSYRYCLIASAHKQGYLGTTVSMPLDMDELPRLVDIELSPNRSIHGQVSDPTNRPLEGARVVAWEAQDSNGEEENCGNEEPVATGDSRARGEFTLHVAEDVGYCLQAFHPDWSRSQPQRVTSADLAGLRLQLGYRARVSGTTVDSQGNPLVDLSLAFIAQQPGGARDQALASTDRNGNFVFDHLDYTRYQVTSGSPGYQVAEPQEIVVSEAEDQQEITVKAFPVTVVNGRVLDVQGQPLARTTVTAYSPYNKSDSIAETVSDARGEFRLTSLHRSDVAYETFRMAVAMLDGAAANRPFSGKLCVDIFHPSHGSHTLSVSAVDASLDLGSIQLQPGSAIQVEGRVLNHRGQAVSATLAITIDESQSGQVLEARMPRCDDVTLSRRISTDAAGQFSFNVPKAGTYSVEVRTDRYKTRTFDLQLTASVSNVEIKLD